MRIREIRQCSTIRGHTRLATGMAPWSVGGGLVALCAAPLEARGDRDEHFLILYVLFLLHEQLRKARCQHTPRTSEKRRTRCAPAGKNRRHRCSGGRFSPLSWGHSPRYRPRHLPSPRRCSYRQQTRRTPVSLKIVIGK